MTSLLYQRHIVKVCSLPSLSDHAALRKTYALHTNTDAIIKLMRSLPRYQLSDVHAELTTYLQRDILGVSAW